MLVYLLVSLSGFILPGGADKSHLIIQRKRVLFLLKDVRCLPRTGVIASAVAIVNRLGNLCYKSLSRSIAFTSLPWSAQ